uniref:Uncharacterized protein n=1 Tax=Romanomermis culicivorax TaxID=13658 RepID=A0A915IX58_ROMCU
MASYGQQPHFHVILLRNCEACDLHIAYGEIHTHRIDLPTSKQIWHSISGEPPDIAGIELYGKKGGMTRILSFNLNVDLACYPPLFLYGTQGYKYRILKADPNNKRANNDLAAQFNAGKDSGTLYMDDDLD